MKKCLSCQKIKDISAFYVDNLKKDKLRIYCKDCDSKKALSYYRNNVKKRLQFQKDKREQNRRIMVQLKINGCAICGYNKCNRALDFHHVNPEGKKFNLGLAYLNTKDSEIIDELNKCILLCKNCHSEIEQKKRGK